MGGNFTKTAASMVQTGRDKAGWIWRDRRNDRKKDKNQKKAADI